MEELMYNKFVFQIPERVYHDTRPVLGNLAVGGEKDPIKGDLRPEDRELEDAPKLELFV
jgi:hypothetical protein